jgi:hypothetical protein
VLCIYNIVFVILISSYIYIYKPKGDSPCMFSVQFFSPVVFDTGVCFVGMLEWFIGGDQLTAMGSHAA